MTEGVNIASLVLSGQTRLVSEAVLGDVLNVAFGKLLNSLKRAHEGEYISGVIHNGIQGLLGKHEKNKAGCSLREVPCLYLPRGWASCPRARAWPW